MGADVLRATPHILLLEMGHPFADGGFDFSLCFHAIPTFIFSFAAGSSSESFGLSVIEAMTCGTPAIATRRGSMPVIVDGITGFLVDSLDEAN
ncbi:glycosyltransferase [Roseiconus lacunae]|uniref:glycosyltransferase n=1 Tax=Roseiconus lacunae TaxID=2605694 RepID=UPI00308AB74F|nr:glycosyltransferase [Stieleria sp. HD01]